ARQAYIDNLAKLMNAPSQQITYCANVIGLCESLLFPESAKFRCEGLEETVDLERDLSPLAMNCKFKDGSSFYPAHKTKKGLGYDSCCGINGDGPQILIEPPKEESLQGKSSNSPRKQKTGLLGGAS